MFSASDAYERFMGRWSRQLGHAFVAFAGVRAGDVVLDAGAGTGALTSAVLAIDRTRVTGVDPSSAYVQAARARTTDARATFEEGDVQNLRFADGTFDQALSMLVLNFVPDSHQAVAELARVTRPDGVVAAAVWDYGGEMQMLRWFWDEAVALDPAFDARDESHMPLSRAGELAALWRQHRLADVEETPLVMPMVFPTFDDFWLPFLGGQGPAGALVSTLTPDRSQELRNRLRRRMETGAKGPIRLTARAWAVKGKVTLR